MKLSIAQETTVVCSCCGNRVKTIWAFEQEMVAGHLPDGTLITEKSEPPNKSCCLGGYSAVEHHRTLDFDPGES